MLARLYVLVATTVMHVTWRGVSLLHNLECCQDQSRGWWYVWPKTQLQSRGMRSDACEKLNMSACVYFTISASRLLLFTHLKVKCPFLFIYHLWICKTI